MNKKKLPIEVIKIDKLVNGGQGMGLLSDGRKCFVWGALPGEEAEVQLTKKKKDWAEGYVINIIKPSKYRIEPVEPDMYLATSPWQIINYPKEAEFKQRILQEAFEREGLQLDWRAFYQDSREYGYRNKMEYNFWYDNDTTLVSLALHRRGSHQKISVNGSALASSYINQAGQALVEYINTNNIEARPLKSVILRSDSSGKTGVSLFVNNKDITAKFDNFKLNNTTFEIIYSNPKSPASVVTEVLKEDKGNLTDRLLDFEFKYSTRSFFQVNILVYEHALKLIKTDIELSKTTKVTDLYSGVGSIGLSVTNGLQYLTMIETSAESTDQAKNNIGSKQNVQIITADAEDALDYLDKNSVIILDPPRAGLHKDVIAKLIELRPPKIIYLSCNPSTQARDVKLLSDGAAYKVKFAQGFNFFPKTPHIESLTMLQIK